MTLDAPIDPIFAVQNGGYSFEVLDTVPTKGEVPVPGGTVGFSDHTGYLSTLRIRSTGCSCATMNRIAPDLHRQVSF